MKQSPVKDFDSMRLDSSFVNFNIQRLCKNEILMFALKDITQRLISITFNAISTNSAVFSSVNFSFLSENL